MSFRMVGLPAEIFAPVFALDDAALAAQSVVRQSARGSEPCRVSLTDAAPGEAVYLVNYEHHPVASPYRGRYAVFVRPGETQFVGVDTVPESLRKRMLAAPAFDADGMSVAVQLVPGTEVEGVIEAMFAEPRTAYIHLHYAAAGCYAARVERA